MHFFFCHVTATVVAAICSEKCFQQIKTFPQLTSPSHHGIILTVIFFIYLFFLLPVVRYQPRIDALEEVWPCIFFPLDKSFREELLYSAQAMAINACVMFLCTHLHGLLIMILHHVRLVMPVSRAEPFDQKEGRMQAGLLIPASPCHLFTRI